MRLIDADALEKELLKVISKRHKKRTVLTLYMLLDIIGNRNTIDATPIKHGKWLICCDGYYPYCSVCGSEPLNRNMTNYCPKCGAKMKGNFKDV